MLLLVGYLMVIRTAERRERRGCCPLLFGGGLSGDALLCGFAACNGCGAVLGCGRLCGGRLRDRASGREISSVGCAFAARAVSFSDGGGLLLMGDSRISAGASGRRGAVSCLGQAFCLSLFPYETHFLAQVAFLREYFSFRRYCSGKKEKFAKPSFFLV